MAVTVQSVIDRVQTTLQDTTGDSVAGRRRAGAVGQ